MKIILSVFLMFITTSVYAHTNLIDDDPDPCLNLAIPYDLCLETIGKEWWERQKKNAPPSLESRIKEFEEKIAVLLEIIRQNNLKGKK